MTDSQLSMGDLSVSLRTKIKVLYALWDVPSRRQLAVSHN